MIAGGPVITTVMVSIPWAPMLCHTPNSTLNITVLFYNKRKMFGAVFIPVLKLGKQTQQRLKTGPVCFSREDPGCETRVRHELPC